MPVVPFLADKPRKKKTKSSLEPQPLCFRCIRAKGTGNRLPTTEKIGMEAMCVSE